MTTHPEPVSTQYKAHLIKHAFLRFNIACMRTVRCYGRRGTATGPTLACSYAYAAACLASSSSCVLALLDDTRSVAAAGCCSCRTAVIVSPWVTAPCSIVRWLMHVATSTQRDRQDGWSTGPCAPGAHRPCTQRWAGMSAQWCRCCSHTTCAHEPQTRTRAVCQDGPRRRGNRRWGRALRPAACQGKTERVCVLQATYRGVEKEGVGP